MYAHSRMYIKREQSWRGLSGGSLGAPAVSRLPSSRRPSTLRQSKATYPRTSSTIKNETHPIMHCESDGALLSEDLEDEEGYYYYGSQRTKKGLTTEESLPGGDTSPYNTLTAADAQKLRAVKKESRIGTIFPFNTKSKLDLLNEILEGYSESGLPAMPELLTIGREQYDEHIFQLESHWTEVVQAPENLSKRERHHQERVWEIVHTEVETIHKLQVIKDLFQCCLINLQQDQLLNEIEVDRVFSNICDVYYANAQFWDQYMYRMVQEARDTGQPINPALMKEGFLQFEEIFKPYTKFCLEQENCLEYLKKKKVPTATLR